METIIKVNKREQNWILIFNFIWELDESNVDETFEKIYNDIKNIKSKKIIFNFNELKYINSRSIWYITDILSNLEKLNWKLFLSNCKEWIKNILDIVGITWIIPTFKEEEEAIKSMK